MTQNIRERQEEKMQPTNPTPYDKPLNDKRHFLFYLNTVQHYPVGNIFILLENFLFLPKIQSLG